MSAFYQLGASVLSPGTRPDQWRRYKQETELVSGFFFMRPGRDKTISASDTSQSTSTHEILNIYHVSSFIYLLDTPNPPLVSTLTRKFPHRLPGEVWHSRGHDYETRLRSTMTSVNRTEKSGDLWISKRKRFLSYFTSYLMLLCFLFSFPVDGQWPMSETWTWLNIPGFNVTLRVQY